MVQSLRLASRSIKFTKNHYNKTNDKYVGIMLVEFLNK
jgi:hypothetical protein